MDATTSKCNECKSEQLTFALRNGKCYYCDGTLVIVDGQVEEA